MRRGCSTAVGEPVDPKPAGIKLPVRRSVAVALVRHDGFCGQLARAQGVVNSLSGKWLNNPRRVPTKYSPGWLAGSAVRASGAIVRHG